MTARGWHDHLQHWLFQHFNFYHLDYHFFVSVYSMKYLHNTQNSLSFAFAKIPLWAREEPDNNQHKTIWFPSELHSNYFIVLSRQGPHHICLIYLRKMPHHSSLDKGLFPLWQKVILFINRMRMMDSGIEVSNWHVQMELPISGRSFVSSNNCCSKHLLHHHFDFQLSLNTIWCNCFMLKTHGYFAS